MYTTHMYTGICKPYNNTPFSPIATRPLSRPRLGTPLCVRPPDPAPVGTRHGPPES